MCFCIFIDVCTQSDQKKVICMIYYVQFNIVEQGNRLRCMGTEQQKRIGLYSNKSRKTYDIQYI